MRKLALALIGVCLPLAACGLQAHPGTVGVKITITRDFGSRPVRTIAVDRGTKSLTALALLQRQASIQLGPAGQVRSIDGITAAPGQRWSYFINGIGMTGPLTGPTAPTVHAGDRVWWDLHPSAAAVTVPAAVGAFPEPFLRGSSGKRFPTTLECAADEGSACRRVADALAAIGVPAATQALGTGSGQDTIGVLVGTWSELSGTIVAQLLAHGPSLSGVYARFGPGGARLELLDARGTPARAFGAGAGLLAATRDNSAAPTWVVTGTDRAGVSSAARALDQAVLRDRYAVAAVGGRVIPLPVVSAAAR